MARGGVLDMFDHRGSTTGKVGGSYYFGATLWMRQNGYIRKLLSDINDVFHGEFVMDLTSPQPSNHLVIQVAFKILSRVEGRENNVLASFPGHIPGEVF